MLEIVFSDNACGSLKYAQHIGTGAYPGDCIASAITVLHSDGSAPTEEELQQELEKNERAVWEKAVPMGGNPADVYGFALCLSVGDISTEGFFRKRQATLDQILSTFSNDTQAASLLQEAQEALQEVLSRSIDGEPIRIWYSNQPDEACGLCWFMAQLESLRQPYGDVVLIPLPPTEQRGNTVVRHTSWSEIAPEDWISYLPLEQPASPAFCKACAQKWHALQRENAPLRAVINGQLLSVSETLYDSFIVQEIAQQGDTFQEAEVIGRVLGRYSLGISDMWIAQRIEQMIASGMLEPVTQPGKEDPVYHRLLKKIK